MDLTTSTSEGPFSKLPITIFLSTRDGISQNLHWIRDRTYNWDQIVKLYLMPHSAIILSQKSKIFTLVQSWIVERQLCQRMSCKWLETGHDVKASCIQQTSVLSSHPEKHQKCVPKTKHYHIVSYFVYFITLFIETIHCLLLEQEPSDINYYYGNIPYRAEGHPKALKIHQEILSCPSTQGTQPTSKQAPRLYFVYYIP